MEVKTAEEITKQDKDRIYKLMQLCNDPNTKFPQLREELHTLVNQNQTAKKFMEMQHGIYAVALRERIDNMKSSDAIKEVMLVKTDQLREELGYSTANQLERLAIEQIVICWITHYETEIKHASVLSQSQTREIGIYWEKRLSFTARRYSRALELLSRMRKMNLTIQVNNAHNQLINNGKI